MPLNQQTLSKDTSISRDICLLYIEAQRKGDQQQCHQQMIVFRYINHHEGHLPITL